MKYLHSCGLVNPNLKPEDILLDEMNRPSTTDLGQLNMTAVFLRCESF